MTLFGCRQIILLLFLDDCKWRRFAWMPYLNVIVNESFSLILPLACRPTVLTYGTNFAKAKNLLFAIIPKALLLSSFLYLSLSLLIIFPVFFLFLQYIFAPIFTIVLCILSPNAQVDRMVRTLCLCVYIIRLSV